MNHKYDEIIISDFCDSQHLSESIYVTFDTKNILFRTHLILIA